MAAYELVGDRFCGTLRITDEVAGQKGAGIAEQNRKEQ